MLPVTVTTESVNLGTSVTSIERCKSFKHHVAHHLQFVLLLQPETNSFYSLLMQIHSDGNNIHLNKYDSREITESQLQHQYIYEVEFFKKFTKNKIQICHKSERDIK